MGTCGVDASVLIPSYNSKRTLIPCLEHLADQTYASDRFEVIVVLDGSTDGSGRALQEIRVPYKLKVIEQANRGRAAALNRGARDAAGEYLIVIDSDILVNREFIEAHLAAHGQGDVVLGPIPLSDRSPVNFLSDGVKAWADQHTQKMTQSEGDISCTDTYGANVSILRSHFHALGGYHENLRRAEDYHLGKCITQAGLTIVFCPSAIAAQIYDKTVYGTGHDFYVDGRSHVSLIAEFPELKSSVKAGRYYPQTLTKRCCRPLVIRRHPIGRCMVGGVQLVLEWARRLGLRWHILSACQGVVADSLYFRGVYDEIGDQDRFHAFIQPE